MFWKVCLQMLKCGQGGLAPIDLKVESFYHRAAPGGTGGVKTIGNYAPVSLLSSLHFIMDCGVMFGNHYDQGNVSRQGIGAIKFWQWPHDQFLVSDGHVSIVNILSRNSSL